MNDCPLRTVKQSKSSSFQCFLSSVFLVFILKLYFLLIEGGVRKKCNTTKYYNKYTLYGYCCVAEVVLRLP